MSDGEGEVERNVAHSYTVPELRIVSVEHPCIVKNFDKGFKSLGGEQHLKHVGYVAHLFQLHVSWPLMRIR